MQVSHDVEFKRTIGRTDLINEYDFSSVVIPEQIKDQIDIRKLLTWFSHILGKNRTEVRDILRSTRMSDEEMRQHDESNVIMRGGLNTPTGGRSELFWIPGSTEEETTLNEFIHILEDTCPAAVGLSDAGVFVSIKGTGNKWEKIVPEEHLVTRYDDNNKPIQCVIKGYSGLHEVEFEIQEVLQGEHKVFDEHLNPITEEYLPSRIYCGAVKIKKIKHKKDTGNIDEYYPKGAENQDVYQLLIAELGGLNIKDKVSLKENYEIFEKDDLYLKTIWSDLHQITSSFRYFDKYNLNSESSIDDHLFPFIRKAWIDGQIETRKIHIGGNRTSQNMTFLGDKDFDRAKVKIEPYDENLGKVLEYFVAKCQRILKAIPDINLGRSYDFMNTVIDSVFNEIEICDENKLEIFSMLRKTIFINDVEFQSKLAITITKNFHKFTEDQLELLDILNSRMSPHDRDNISLYLTSGEIDLGKNRSEIIYNLLINASPDGGFAEQIIKGKIDLGNNPDKVFELIETVST